MNNPAWAIGLFTCCLYPIAMIALGYLLGSGKYRIIFYKLLRGRNE